VSKYAIRNGRIASRLRFVWHRDRKRQDEENRCKTPRRINLGLHRENVVALRKKCGHIASLFPRGILGMGTIYHGAVFDRNEKK
jgi:hypothetical protein